MSPNYELEWLGFYLNKVGGLFDDPPRAQLETFCEENPEYHIMTTTAPGLLVNQYVPAKDNLIKMANTRGRDRQGARVEGTGLASSITAL